MTKEEWKCIAENTLSTVVHKSVYENSSYYPEDENFYGEELFDYESGERVFSGYIPMRGSRWSLNGGKNGRANGCNNSFTATAIYEYPLKLYKKTLKSYERKMKCKNTTIELNITSDALCGDSPTKLPLDHFLAIMMERRFYLFCSSYRKIEEYFCRERRENKGVTNVFVCAVNSRFFLTNDESKADSFADIASQLV